MKSIVQANTACLKYPAMKKFHTLLLLACLSVISACKKEPGSPALEAQTMLDVSYGSDARHKMDVYLPENRTEDTPVILMLHGGGFVAGNKSDISARAQALSAKGFVVLNTNYRLVDISGVLDNPMVHKPSSVKIAEQLSDIQAAVDFAAAKSSEWKMSSSKWGIAGHSAGGTLALLYAYGDKNTGKRVKVAGNWAGATTFGFSDQSEILQVDPRIAEVLYRAIGAEATNANKLAYMAHSPYWVANAGRAIPTINIRPENNEVGDMPDGSLVLYQQFTNVLNSKGVANKWVEVSGADHGFSQAGKWDLVLDETAAFFRLHL